MIFIEGYDRKTGRTWATNDKPGNMDEAKIMASNLNNMEARKTDGIVQISYTAREINEDTL